MPRPRKNAGWSLAKKTFLKKKKKRTPPPRASSDDDSDDEDFARRLAAARAAREQQRHPDASSSAIPCTTWRIGVEISCDELHARAGSSRACVRDARARPRARPPGAQQRVA